MRVRLRTQRQVRQPNRTRQATGAQGRVCRQTRQHHRGGQQGLLHLHFPAQWQIAFKVRQQGPHVPQLRRASFRCRQQPGPHRGHRLPQPLRQGLRLQRRVPVHLRQPWGGERAVQRPHRDSGGRARQHHRSGLGQLSHPSVRRPGLLSFVREHFGGPPPWAPGADLHRGRPHCGGGFRQPLLQSLQIPAVNVAKLVKYFVRINLRLLARL